MKQLNFVFVSLQRIHTERDSTSTNIAKELAKEHRVLYINSPVDRRTLLLEGCNPDFQDHFRLIKNKNIPNLENTQDNLWVLNPRKIIESINWVPFTSIFRLFNRRNNRIFAGEIQTAIRELGFDEFILVNDKDIFRSFHLKELLKPRLEIYLDRDYIIGMDYWKKHGSVLEPELMRSADLVLCNSEGFRKRAATYNKASYYIGNGCNIDRFDISKQFDLPEDLKRIPGRPIIGYIGALLSMRLDIALLLFLAESKPNWDVVLIGQEDDDFRQSQLHQLGNVHFLGKRDTALAPAYIQWFDVCINPQIVNAITNDNYPLKIDEYLAMGKPIVATKTNLMEEVFASVVSLATSPVDFVVKIERILDMQPDLYQTNRRIELAHSHSWSAICADMLEIIYQKLK